MTKTETRNAAKQFIAHLASEYLQTLSGSAYIAQDVILDSAEGKAIAAEVDAIVAKMLAASR